MLMRYNPLVVMLIEDRSSGNDWRYVKPMLGLSGHSAKVRVGNLCWKVTGIRDIVVDHCRWRSWLSGRDSQDLWIILTS